MQNYGSDAYLRMRQAVWTEIAHIFDAETLKSMHRRLRREFKVSLKEFGKDAMRTLRINEQLIAIDNQLRFHVR